MKYSSFIFIAFLALFLLMVLLFQQSYEGMISYNESSSLMNQVVIPQYSTQPVYKLYDSIYFDNMNGNVIELFGESFGGANVDMTGSSLTDLTLMSRNATKIASSSLYEATVQTIDLSNGTVLSPMVDFGLIPNYTGSTYTNWVYPTNLDLVSMSSDTTTIPNYQVIYIPWGTETIVHIYNYVLSTNIATYYFRQNSDPIHSLSTCNVPIPTTYTGNGDTTNVNSYVSLSGYDNGKNVFQVSDNVYFDTTNRYLIVKSKNGLTIYNGTTDTNGPVKIETNTPSITGTPSSFSYQDFNVLYIADNDGSNLVLYIPVSYSKTLVAVLSVDSTNYDLLSIKNVVRFNTSSSNGVDGLSNVTIPKTATTSTTTTKTTTTSDICNNTVVDKTSSSTIKFDEYDYYRTLLQRSGSKGRVSEDYILKTKIVPPVCPSCPACPSVSCANSKVCSNCGGHGGSGLYDTSSNSWLTTNKGSKTMERIGNDIKSAGNSVLSGTERVGRDIGSAGNAVLSGAERIGKDIGSAGNAIVSGAERVGSDIGSVGSSAISGVERVGKDIGSASSSVVSGVMNTGERLGNNLLYGSDKISSGIIDTAENIGSGLWNGVKTVGSDVKGAFALNPTKLGTTSNEQSQSASNKLNANQIIYSGYSGNPMYSGYSNGVTSLNYMGQLPESKQSNFIPITSDFSKFGR